MRNQICAVLLLAAALAARAADAPPAWEKAHLQKPMTADETRAFMKKLAQFVVDNHMRKDANSPQRGMIYEYLDMTRKGEFDQFVEGEALDTMHDGAWFAAAMVTAYRATGDPFYKDILAKWQLPFYLKMLNHSDELFSAQRDDARHSAHKWGKEWLLQEGEKGFVPYFWDDGGSVSLDRRRDKNPLGVYSCVDHLAGKPNPKFLLDGYALGSSNHMAQDLGVMLELAWLLFRESPDEADKKLTAEIAGAAKNLYECRMRHHGPIPMCVAPWALASGDPKLMMSVPDPYDKGLWTPNNHYTRALRDFEPGKSCPFPAFADDQEYLYYHGIACAGGRLLRPLAFKLIYDAYTQPMLFRYYCDDWEVPPGINIFDLYPYNMKDGRPTDYRSERKGPHDTPKPIGSRFGPQNMVVCGWALQALKEYPEIWDQETEANRVQSTLILHTWESTSTHPPGCAFVQSGGIGVLVSSSHSALELAGNFAGDAATLRIYTQRKGEVPVATIAFKKDQAVTAVNDRGEPLIINEAPRPKGGYYIPVNMKLPYSLTKGQKPWANCVEHGSLRMVAGDKSYDVYFAGLEDYIQAWLRRELAGGLRTWEAIFNEKGYIPTGMGTSDEWDKFSDTGGYAHLISAAAQWLFVLEGKRDWETHHVPETIKK